MALGGGDCLGIVLAHEGRGEADPSGKIAGFYDPIPDGDHGAETGAV